MATRNAFTSRLRPFLKWAGNKYRIIERILGMLPPGGRLIEPFAGSAAVFLNSDYERYLLADTNADLINLYKILKHEGTAFIDECAPLFTARNTRPERYYRLREEFNRCEEPRRRAALFVYLNRHGYNGLCRYNASGGFNVPFGRYKQPYFPSSEMLAFHQKAQAVRAVFRPWDFTRVIESAKPGDVIYCDPPYVPLSASANFTTYSPGGFALEQQCSLARHAARAARRGIPVLISNHDTQFTQDAYQGAQLDQFQVRRYISCNGQRRKSAGELLALFQ
ncbi:MAG: Dam family site-specific DNA-(adenine-N6)-methyltransferase [Pseudolabrys sp.]